MWIVRAFNESLYSHIPISVTYLSSIALDQVLSPTSSFYLPPAKQHIPTFAIGLWLSCKLVILSIALQLSALSSFYAATIPLPHLIALSFLPPLLTTAPRNSFNFDKGKLNFWQSRDHYYRSRLPKSQPVSSNACHSGNCSKPDP